MNYLLFATAGVLATVLYGLVKGAKPRKKDKGGWGGLGISGDFGGGEETTTQQTQKNIYTKEQEQLLKDLIGGISPTISPTTQAITQQLTAGLAGQPTPAESAWLRQAKEGVAGTYKGIATQGTEALAGRGVAGGGIANRLMQNLMTGQARGEQAAETQGLQMQQENLWKAIANALGLTQLGAGLSTAARGQTGTATQTTSGDYGGLGGLLGAGLGLAAAPFTAGTSLAMSPLTAAVIGSLLGTSGGSMFKSR